jgi:hypothetical protein
MGRRLDHDATEQLLSRSPMPCQSFARMRLWVTPWGVGLHRRVSPSGHMVLRVYMEECRDVFLLIIRS